MPLKDPAGKKARDERHRQRHAERSASGTCTRCGRLPPEPGRKVCTGCATRSAAPPSAPAGPEPANTECRTAAAIPSSAAAPTALATGAAAGRGRRRDYARPAASAGRKRTAPSASHAARHGAHAIAGAMTRERPPAAACAAGSPRSGTCRAAAGASRWRRSASAPRKRAPPGRDDMSRGARRAPVWTVESAPVARPAVSAAHTGPTPARQSVTWRRSGRRRSP